MSCRALVAAGAMCYRVFSRAYYYYLPLSSRIVRLLLTLSRLTLSTTPLCTILSPKMTRDPRTKGNRGMTCFCFQSHFSLRRFFSGSELSRSFSDSGFGSTLRQPKSTPSTGPGLLKRESKLWIPCRKKPRVNVYFWAAYLEYGAFTTLQSSWTSSRISAHYISLRVMDFVTNHTLHSIRQVATTVKATQL